MAAAPPLTNWSEKSRVCIANLQTFHWDPQDLSEFPIASLAAVLVLLYEDSGTLRVLLTTRSKELRTHAGQTALPGGRVDTSDNGITDTALREAYEEVDLPLGNKDVHPFAIMDPFLSLHRLIVTPVVAVLTNLSILDQLKPSASEVANIFNHPLEALLDPNLAHGENLVARKSEDWPYETELHDTTDSIMPLLGSTPYRMHRFRSSASPIKGLTADILIRVAEVAYGRAPVYDRYAPNQIRGWPAVKRVAFNSDSVS
ncbi:hypothetical protein BDN72DRAFT_791881 [Pluteus cervinus]|uniref:Uncharacterized protein n=1 Tax=Pluteus cervinus TaxID=181527 RepID=A0ACD3B5B3_9AGAR|nr:hypothetical protein BDN72DRAFT_791881 [Pluteus cervinus]